MEKYVIGLDYGSDSARAIVVNALTGETLATAVKYYPRWKEGKYCNPAINQYRQHPQDYIDVLEASVKEALAACPAGTAEKVVGIAFDTTGSTPAFTDATGTPLALLPEFAENPNAMFVLWKDHTAIREAAEINRLCGEWNIDYSAYEGGIYSSEWFWAKALHVLREDEHVRAKAYSIVEYCEWLPALITGVTKSDDIVRSRCACGHKAMWHEQWGGLPSEEFLTTLDPLLAGFRSRLFEKTETADKPVGKLSPEWAERLGLTTEVVVAGGAFDCHMGAVGAGVTPHTFVRVIGTSTCDVMRSLAQGVSFEQMGEAYRHVVHDPPSTDEQREETGRVLLGLKQTDMFEVIVSGRPDGNDRVKSLIDTYLSAFHRRMSERSAESPSPQGSVLTGFDVREFV